MQSAAPELQPDEPLPAPFDESTPVGETSRTYVPVGVLIDPPPGALLLTGVAMPVTSGRELVERVRPMRPEAKIMYMSGYPADIIGTHGVPVSDGFVQKPFTPSGLVEKVREVSRT